MKNVSKLGFGMMRLPMLDNEIDLVKTQEMVDAYMAGGGNYFDTSVAYGAGKSERAICETVVKKYPRDSYYLTDKMPVWFARSKGDLEKIFQEQLKRCKTTYFDFYMLHSLDAVHSQALQYQIA